MLFVAFCVIYLKHAVDGLMQKFSTKWKKMGECGTKWEYFTIFTIKHKYPDVHIYRRLQLQDRFQGKDDFSLCLQKADG